MRWLPTAVYGCPADWLRTGWGCRGGGIPGPSAGPRLRRERPHPCPCCGHRMLDAMPGSYEICPVCCWEDDGVQFRWLTVGGGANKVSLIDRHPSQPLGVQLWFKVKHKTAQRLMDIGIGQ
ncbi:CPCC family cysteine-rich protein [Streptomyces sp. QL37]|uniref:CPCC family cysteine-rich protein n=1 Tax=Streptomyces sp. QL37 TaxID=2093747 RepID=UPI000CF2A09F|nr:CPCC family cysteine-rich protein [Streptomyces sp. QL37]PPQ62481.1 hypothetical protein C5F59_24650 [Streptomyces sp. QL37]